MDFERVDAPVREGGDRVMEAEERGLHAQAWGASFALHGIAVMLAALLVSHMKTLPPQEVFHWNVSLVEPVQEQSAEPRGEAVSPPMPVQQPQVRPMKQGSATSQAALQGARTRRPSSTIHEEQRKPLETEQLIESPFPQSLPAPSVMQQQVPDSLQSLKSVGEVDQIRDTGAAPDPVAESAAAPMAETKKPSTVQPTASTQTASLPSEKSEQTIDSPHGSLPSQPAILSEDSIAPSSSIESIQTAREAVRQVPSNRTDYGWLIESLSTRLTELKRYPTAARSNGLEGKVLLRAVIRADGQVVEVRVQKSSGYDELDAAALETMSQASPLHLRHELGRAQVAITVPLVYRLAR